MISKLPPKYTFLFLVLFIFNGNKEEFALDEGACFCSFKHRTGKTHCVLPPTSVLPVSGAANAVTGLSGLESYQWHKDLELRIRT